MSKTLADLIDPRIDPNTKIRWTILSRPAQRWLDRVFSQAQISPALVAKEIPFAVLNQVFVQDLHLARNVGPLSRAKLIAELKIAYGASNPSNYSELESLASSELSSQSNVEVQDFHPSTLIPPGTLSELVDYYAERVNEAFGLYERLEILKCRSLVFTTEPETLQEIGDRHNVTRERIRQILKSVEGFIIPDFADIPCLDSLVCLAENSATADDFAKAQIDNADEKVFALAQVQKICEVYCQTQLLERLQVVEKNWADNEKSLDKIRRDIRSLRNTSAILDVEYFANKFEVSQAKMKDLIVSVYPRTLFFDHYCLARTAQLIPATERTVYRLLKEFPNLPIQRIAQGVIRRSHQRGDVVTIPDQALYSLIFALAGNPPLVENMQQVAAMSGQLDNNDEWILKIFRESPCGYLHRNEVSVRALHDGINFGSVSVYLASSPYLYTPSEKSGMFVRVDVTPSHGELALHRQRVLQATPENVIQHRFEGGVFVLELQLNIGTASGGSLGLPAELNGILNGKVFSVYCNCGNLQSTQKLKLSKGFFRSVTPFVHHLHALGEYKIDSKLIIELDFQESKATLRHV